MSKPVLGCEIALAIPLGVVLLYYVFKISIDITPIIIEYVRYVGIDLTKYVDPSLITSSLACGILILLNGLNYVLDVTGVWDKFIKNLEKPMDKELGDEQMGLDYSLPLYHTAGTIGNASAVSMRSGYGDENEYAQAFLRRGLLEVMMWGCGLDIMNIEVKPYSEQWRKGSKESGETETETGNSRPRSMRS
ncbi:MAG: hypothetical protein L6R42_004096 [Xanthoria sp. 1 TBL-2021]|nr:MAG: hypothetical protein L6R42_004096 [Xanthoria sp. 1 TBL-2021]